MSPTTVIRTAGFVLKRTHDVIDVFTDLPTPLAHWPLNQQHQLNDISGNDLHFELITGNINASVDPINGQEFIYLDGTFQGRVHHNNYLTLTDNYTIFFAISSRHLGPVFVFGVVDESSRGLGLYIHNDLWHVYLHCWPDCAEHTVSHGSFFRDSVWNYVAITFDSAAGVLRLYRNGQLFSENTVTGTAELSTDDGYLFIGHHATGSAAHTYTPEEYGRLACLQIYDQTLRAIQIQKLILQCQGKTSFEGNCSKGS